MTIIHRAGKTTSGVVYTPGEVARMVVRLALRRWLDGQGKDAAALRRITVLDPACGDGEFLAAALEAVDEALCGQDPDGHGKRPAAERRGEIAARSLFGADIDARAIRTARNRLPGTHLRMADSLLADPWRRRFDLIVGNPPYVRQEEIRGGMGRIPATRGPGYVEAVRERVSGLGFGSLDALGWSRRADLFTYFFPVGLAWLAEQGVLAFITSNAWLDAEYGRGLRRLLIESDSLGEIIGHDREQVFRGRAEVNTVVVVCGGRIPLTRSSLRSSRPLPQGERGLVSWGGMGKLGPPTVPAEAAGTPPPGGGGRGASKEGMDHWSLHLRAPAVYHRIMAGCEERLVGLPELVELKYGCKTGAVEFFRLSNEQVRASGIEPEFLVPLVTSSSHLETLRAGPDAWLFVCDRPKEELKGTAALEHIRRGERKGLPARRSVRGHRPFWYSVRPVPFDLLLPQFWDRRFFVPTAATRTACTNNFFCARSRRLPVEALAGMLNSTLCFVELELLGRTNQGMGVLTTYGPDWAAVQLPDPSALDLTELVSAFRQLARRAVLPVDREMMRADRARLDAAVLGPLRVSAREQAEIREALVRLVAARVRRGARRNRPEP